MEKRFDNLLGLVKDQGAAQAIETFSIFNHDTWLRSIRDLATFGPEQWQILIDFFHTPLEKVNCNFDRLNDEWRDLKLLMGSEFADLSYSVVWQRLLSKEPYKSDFKNILLLVEIMMVLPISSAECERGLQIHL